MVLLLFFWSGVTALVYEVFWSKYLALMFGSTMQAQTVVLAVFMGGLALGNRLFGHRADQARQPLALYGWLELAIGLYAFCFWWFYQLADAVFVRLGSKLLEQTAALLLLKAILSAGLLLGPTILMGGTLPVLAAWLQRRYPDASRWSARFYSVNSLGAVLGAGLGGFFLVRWLGMISSLQMTALVNVLIGFTAMGLARLRPCLSPPPVTAAAQARVAGAALQPATAPPGQPNSVWWVGCLLVATTGAVSMGLEILASRGLAMIFGPSLQAFAIVLMAFILGIGAGGAVMASPRVRSWPRERTTFALLLLAAGLLAVYVQGIERWADVYRWFMVGLARNETGYRLQLLGNGLIALILLGLPAGLLGAVLPLWMREGSADPRPLGDWVGRLLTWNTLGAVGGVLLTGFVLMPLLGLRNAFGLLALLLSVGAVLLAGLAIHRRAALLATGVAGFVVWTLCSGGEGWRYVLSSGVFRARETEFDAKAMEMRKKYKRILFYEDAADATVSVEQGVGVASPELSLRINGKTDATTRSDLSTQYLLAHLPLLARPESQDVFVLGFGSGITAGALLGHPIQRLTVAENCAAVLRAGARFTPFNRNVLASRLTHLWREDARTVLKLSAQKYDVIISEPSNPWTAGIGSVFSREFFDLAARRLKEGGLLAQWFHIYEMHDGIVGLVLRTFGSVFPYVEIWDTSSGDIVLLGSQRPWKSSPETFRQVLARPQPRQDLANIGLKSAEAIWARQLASQRTAFAIAGAGAIQSDEFPVLEYEAPKAFFIGRDSRLLAEYDERTWQSPLASESKRTVLAALDAAVLKPIFEEYHSLNPELARHFALRFKPPGPPDHLDVYIGNQRLPCVFGSADAATNAWSAPPPTGEAMRRWWRAETGLVAPPAQQRESIDEMIRLFHDSKAQTQSGANDWTPSHYAAQAARTCLQLRDWPRAQTVLALGRQLAPAAPQLLYLSRILERDMLRPGSNAGP